LTPKKVETAQDTDPKRGKVDSVYKDFIFVISGGDLINMTLVK
jgi:hypothetical protein